MDLVSMDRKDLDSIEAGSHHINPSSIVPLQGVAEDQIFFTSMLFTTLKTRKLYEARSCWHSKWWCPKAVILIVSMEAPFFLPSNHIQVYAGELARVGAG
ncbi:hypothetical protein LINPERHAP1_LOCUS26035 [Linum perenne]